MKQNAIRYPEWVERISDACLSRTVKEALKAKDTAEGSGALKDVNCASALKSANTTLEQIQYGRVTGPEACIKAATAVRKFTVAAECALPTAKRTRGRRRAS